MTSGRQPLDLSTRLRAWGWYRLVKVAENLSDAALDQEFVQPKEFELARFFHHVKWEGRQPDRRASKVLNLSVFEMMDSTGRFEAAGAWFSSPLWQFLSKPQQTHDYYRRWLQDEIQRRGWFRVSSDDEARFPRETLGWIDPEFESGMTLAYHEAFIRIANLPNLEGVTFLCALFREAYSDYQLDQAQLARNLLQEALRNYLEPLRIPDIYKRCLQQLIAERILRNSWVSEADMPKSEKYNSSNRKKQVDAFLSWYLSRNRLEWIFPSSSYAIVQKNERTNWLSRNKTRFMEIQNSLPPIERRFDEVQWIACEDESEPYRDYDSEEEILSNIQGKRDFDYYMASQSQMKKILAMLEPIPANPYEHSTRLKEH